MTSYIGTLASHVALAAMAHQTKNDLVVHEDDYTHAITLRKLLEPETVYLEPEMYTDRRKPKKPKKLFRV